MKIRPLFLALLCLAILPSTADAAISLSLGASGETTALLDRSTTAQLTFFISGTPADAIALASVDFAFPDNVIVTSVVSGLDDPAYFAFGNLFDSTISQDAPTFSLTVSQLTLVDEAPASTPERWFTLTLDTTGVGAAGDTFDLTLDESPGGFLNGNGVPIDVINNPLSFSVAAAVPEPSSIVFVALASLALARRRRRQAGKHSCNGNE